MQASSFLLSPLFCSFCTAYTAGFRSFAQLSGDREPYRFVLSADTPTQNIDTVDLLMQNQFIDKTERVLSLLEPLFRREVGDFTSSPLALIYCRRFGKSTVLRFLRAVFSPLPVLNGHKFDSIKAKIWSYRRGQEILEMGMHPVVLLDMTQASTTANLQEIISASLVCAGLPEHEAKAGQGTLSPAVQLRKGVLALNARFFNETGRSSKTILLIDEFDKQHRSGDADLRLLSAIHELYSLCKEADSGISLFIVAGLTRMVGSGLSVMNNMNDQADVSLQSKHHGLCGILESELLDSAGKKLEELAQSVFRQDLQSLMKPLRQQWNGFRFGITPGGPFEESESITALYSPLDAWELIRHLSAGWQHKPSSAWLRSMHSEFEFVNFHKRYNTSAWFFQLTKHLAGGWVHEDALRLQLDRQDYIDLQDQFVKRVLFELGLLRVERVDAGMVLLGPPNNQLLRRGFELLMKKVAYVATPTTEEIAEILSREGITKLVEQASAETTALFKFSDWIREYAFQDCLYLLLLQKLPPPAAGIDQLQEEEGGAQPRHEYKVRGEYATWGGRSDIYSEHAGRAAVHIEMKIQKYKSKRSDKQLNDNHQALLKDAEAQVLLRLYSVDGTFLRVAVSGVWSKNGLGWKMDARVRFC